MHGPLGVQLKEGDSAWGGEEREEPSRKWRSHQMKEASIRERGFLSPKPALRFSNAQELYLSLLILVLLACWLACVPGLETSELRPRPRRSHSPRICCRTQIQLGVSGKRRGSISHPSDHTINKGESRRASSWLQLGPAGSQRPRARVRAATEADSGQLRRTLISNTQIPQGGCPRPPPAGEGGGSWGPCGPPRAANTTRVGPGVTSLCVRGGGLLGIGTVYL